MMVSTSSGEGDPCAPKMISFSFVAFDTDILTIKANMTETDKETNVYRMIAPVLLEDCSSEPPPVEELLVLT
jgi:hypothetical protein